MRPKGGSGATRRPQAEHGEQPPFAHRPRKATVQTSDGRASKGALKQTKSSAARRHSCTVFAAHSTVVRIGILVVL